MIKVRLASEDDAEALLGIYSYYIENTAITFEYVIPTVDDFRQRIHDTLTSYPYLVAEIDGKIAGYIYASRFRPRKAYDLSAATSIYLDRDYHRMGIGKKLYEKLEEILKQQNVTNVYAAIADPVEEDEHLNRNSEHFHEAIGYRQVARYSMCGNKFGKWVNIIEMEKIIAMDRTLPKEFIPFEEL